MSKRQSKKSAWILALLMLGAFTLAFQLGAVCALAACGSGATLDTDCDGFIDSLENSGFTLTSGMSLAVYPTVNPIPNCAKAPQGTPRDACVDPATQDYFVIIQRGTNPCTPGTKASCGNTCLTPLFGTSDISDIPTSPLLSEYKSVYGTSSGPLQWVSGIATGFTTHEIYQTSGTSELVTAGGWYAPKITEDLNPCSSWMGLSTPGTITPTAPGSATVWPEKIMNWIETTCSQACFTDSKGNKTCYYAKSQLIPPPAGYSQAPGTFSCKNANNTTYSVDMNAASPNLSPLYHDFIKNVVSHEASHLIHLAFGSGTSADNHWPAGSGTLMEQSIATKVTKDKSGNIIVTLYISTAYASQDPAEHALR